MEEIEYSINISQNTPSIINRFFENINHLDGKKFQSLFGNRYVYDENGHGYCFATFEKNYYLLELGLESKKFYDENGIILTKKTINPYLVSYAKGFKSGYDAFLKKEINNIFQHTNQELAYIIFDRITRSNPPDYGTFLTFISSQIRPSFITKELYFDAGVKAGEFFHAMEIIYSNPMQFVALFNEKFKSENIRQYYKFAQNAKRELAFEELFKPEFVSKIDDLIVLLKANSYIDNSLQWKDFRTKTKNKPAKLFLYLKSKGVINDIDITEALKCFYKHFGLYAYVSGKDPNPTPEMTNKSISTRNITSLNIDYDNELLKDYNLHFLALIDKK